MERPNMLRNQRGFTLTEIILVLVIFAIGFGLFNSVFINNWFAYEDRIKRANLWSEANLFFEDMSFEGRNSRLIEIANGPDSKTVTFTSTDSPPVLTVFTLTSAGTMSRARGNMSKDYGTHADFAACDFSFGIDRKDVLVNLKLKDTIFTRDIHITTSTEIMARN